MTGGHWAISIGVLVAACSPSDDRRACGSRDDCPSGMSCGAQGFCEAGPGGLQGTLAFNTVMDFGAPGHAVRNMTIDTRGSLTPDAYTYGGLAVHGRHDVALWTHLATSWANLDGLAASGAGLWRGESLADSAKLDYVGITSGSSMTMWFEGDVWLEAGSTETFKLTGDDLAFFQIALPGTTAYGPVSDDSANAVPVGTPMTGWYPIRIGHTNGTGARDFDFTHSDTGSAQIRWSRDRLRARASELTGALRTVFGRQLFGGGQLLDGTSVPPISHVEQESLLAKTSFSAPPQGAPGDNRDWSARYSGQVYLDHRGQYTLEIASDGGNRGRLGTGPGSGTGEGHWARDDTTRNVTTTVMANLGQGWNDLSVDYNHVDGEASLQVGLTGPDFAHLEIPADQLRPVEPADDRLVSGSDDVPHSVIDGGGAAVPGTATLAIAGYAGEVVTSLDLTYEIDSPRWDQLEVDLESPAGPSSRVTIRDSIAIPGNGDKIAQLTLPVGLATGPGALLGGPANGTWKVHVYDVVNGGGDSFFKGARLTLHTRGGPEKVATSASWFSPVSDIGSEVFAIDGMSWDQRVPDGATLEVHVRACQQVDCSDDPAWSSPVMRETAFAVTPGRYVQLRVDMTSDGVVDPELKTLIVIYRSER